MKNLEIMRRYNIWKNNIPQLAKQFFFLREYNIIKKKCYIMVDSRDITDILIISSGGYMIDDFEFS